MKKTISLLLATCMLLALFAGCGSSSTSESSADVSDASESAVESEEVEDVNDSAQLEASSNEDEEIEEIMEESETAPDEEVSDEDEEEDNLPSDSTTPDLTITMPLTEDDVSFTMWHDFVPLLAEYMEGMQDNLSYATMEEISGVHMEFTNVSKDSAETAVSLVVASGDYPEIWDGFAGYYVGSIDSAIEDDIIYDLSNYKEMMPNYFSIVDGDEEYTKETYTDSGAMGLAYCLNTEYVIESGLVLRQDWLEELGLNIPVTYDDFDAVLTAMHDAYGACLWTTYLGDDATKSFSAGFDVTAYNSGSETYFIQVDGEVRFSPLESGYLDYLTLMNQWYESGIIYPDFISGTSTTTCDASLVGNGTISMVSCPAGFIDQFYAVGADDSFELIAVNRPVKEEGDVVHLGGTAQMTSTNGFSITTAISDSDPDFEILLKWVDYWYTEEGSLLANYGVENETYIVDEKGEIQYTDLILNNPDGLAFSLCMNRYMLFVGSFLNDNGRSSVSYTEKQAESVETWSSNNGDGAYIYPMAVSLTTEETEAVSTPYNDIATYVESQTLGFITGSVPLSEYDNFCDTIVSMGVEDVMEIYQNCLDRYNAR